MRRPPLVVKVPLEAVASGGTAARDPDYNSVLIQSQ